MADSKSAARKGVRVRIPPRVPHSNTLGGGGDVPYGVHAMTFTQNDPQGRRVDDAPDDTPPAGWHGRIGRPGAPHGPRGVWFPGRTRRWLPIGAFAPCAGVQPAGSGHRGRPRGGTPGCHRRHCSARPGRHGGPGTGRSRGRPGPGLRAGRCHGRVRHGQPIGNARGHHHRGHLGFRYDVHPGGAPRFAGPPSRSAARLRQLSDDSANARFWTCSVPGSPPARSPNSISSRSTPCGARSGASSSSSASARSSRPWRWPARPVKDEIPLPDQRQAGCAAQPGVPRRAVGRVGGSFGARPD